MRFLLALLSISSLISCSAPNSSDSQSQGSVVLCNSASVAGFEYLNPAITAKALTEHPKVKLDLTVTNLKLPQGPSQLLLDLKSSLFSDAGQIIVPAKTKLVAVVDHRCTFAKGY